MSFYKNEYGFYVIGGGGGGTPDKNIYVAQWDNTFTYSLQTIVAYNGFFYQSIINNNTGNIPTDILAWEEINNPTELPPYRDDFVIADWIPDSPSGFYIDIPSSVHLQGNDKFVYVFISSTDTITENTPFGYGDFVQHSNGDIRILSDTAFNGFMSITSFTGSFVGSSIYIPSIPSNWVTPVPTTIQGALDRMSTLLKTLNGGNSIP